MILVLSTPLEKINNTMYSEEILVKTDASILYNLLNLLSLENDVVDSIVVTKRYVDTFGVNTVYEALNTFNTLTQFSVVYVTYTEEPDLFLHNISKKITTLPINLELTELTLDKYYLIINNQYTVDTEEYSMDLLGNSLSIINKCLSLPISERKEYLSVKYNEVFGILTATLSLLNQYEKTLESHNKIASLLNVFRSQYESMLELSNKVQQNNVELKEKVLQWQNTFISLLDEINLVNTSYNSRYFSRVQSTTTVIYFKELEDINLFKYFDNLYPMFRKMGVYCKALVLDEREHINYSQYGYYRIPDVLSKSELANIHKMVKNSDAKTLLDIVSNENFKCELLLVYDKTRHSLPLIENANTFFVGYYNDYNIAYINNQNFISPYEGDWTECAKVLTHPKSQITPTAYNLLCSQLQLTEYIKELFNTNNRPEKSYLDIDFQDFKVEEARFDEIVK